MSTWELHASAKWGTVLIGYAGIPLDVTFTGPFYGFDNHDWVVELRTADPADTLVADTDFVVTDTSTDTVLSVRAVLADTATLNGNYLLGLKAVAGDSAPAIIVQSILVCALVGLVRDTEGS